MEHFDPVTFDPDKLRNSTLVGNWEEVTETYKTHKLEAWKTNIDGDRGTALHVAVNDGLEQVVEDLINEIINNVEGGGGEEGLEDVLKSKNERGDTPLHLAASRGFLKICKLIIGPNEKRKHYLIKARNESGETPLFLAALSWQKLTFAYLFKVYQNDLDNLQVLIRGDSDTILHSAIRREFFDLAFIIINYCPKLSDIQNKKGMTPLKLLATRPSAFRSGSFLTWWRQIIYHSIVEEEIDAKETLEGYYIEADKSGAEKLQFPENYRTCYEFFISLFSWLAEKLGFRGNRSSLAVGEVLAKYAGKMPERGFCWRKSGSGLRSCTIVSKNKGSDGSSATNEDISVVIPPPETSQSHAPLPSPQPEAPEKMKQSLVPPNYATCSLFLKEAYLYVLRLSGVGVEEMRRIKKKHIWGGQLLSALMKTPGSYMGTGGQPIVQNKDETSPFDVGKPVINQNASESLVFNHSQDSSSTGVSSSNHLLFERCIKCCLRECGISKSEEDSEEKIDIKETAFLIAARNGIVEMVRVIQSKIPSALHDTTSDKRNVFHVAVKNRQPLVVETLLKSLNEQDKENMIQAVDNDENTVLHLAAEQLSNETPWKIPGSAMQMMWDITWFEYIKKLVPEHFVFRRNKHDKTSGQLFKSKHKELVKESSEWLKETSESCSVVAALIAGVSFATSGTVPGGTENGKPLLEDKPAFKAFAISSLIGLCFSVTALIMFLSILTSRKTAKDFRRSLPRKLLLGLTSLFISIVALFVSFCAGHFFVLKGKFRQYVFPIYIATCFPVTFYGIAQFPLYLDLLRAIIRKVPLPSDRGDGL